MDAPAMRATDKPLIVLVDDDEATLTLLTEVLQTEAGYQVVAAAAACEAFDTIRSARPALVITDVWLGGRTSGLELAERLASDRATRNIPVLFVSAFPNHKILQKRRNTDFLAKPFDIDELILRVARACRPCERMTGRLA